MSVFFAPLDSFCDDEGTEQDELMSFTSMAKETRAGTIQWNEIHIKGSHYILVYS